MNWVKIFSNDVYSLYKYKDRELYLGNFRGVRKIGATKAEVTLRLQRAYDAYHRTRSTG